MALMKNIEEENGIILNYHRIVSLNKIININNILEISSYTNKSQREKEKEYQILQKKSASGEELTDEERKRLETGINVYINTKYIVKDYNENETIENSYNYLKTLEEFENAIDD